MIFYTIGVFLLGYVGTITCRPQEPHPVLPASGTTPVSIISQTESIDANGNFNYSYETSDGIKREESGVLKHVTGLRSRGNFAPDDNTPDEDDILVQSGSFSYTAPDGTAISLRYVADENGFQPMGDHLPTPPPIPASILRSLSQEQQQQPQQTQFQQQPQRQFQQPIQQPVAQQPQTAVASTQNVPGAS